MFSLPRRVVWVNRCVERLDASVRGYACGGGSRILTRTKCIQHQQQSRDGVDAANSHSQHITQPQNHIDTQLLLHNRARDLQEQRVLSAAQILAPFFNSKIMNNISRTDSISQLVPVPHHVNLSPQQIVRLLSVPSSSRITAALYTYADAITQRHFGSGVWTRGIVEFSNVCVKNCGYCGIRRSRRGVVRYTLSTAEVLECARFCMERRYGTIMLQSGELPTEKRISWLAELIRKIRDDTKMMDPAGRGLCVALSVGELSRKWYETLYEAGARRYLLRIETSSPWLYSKLHPANHSWHNRVECLRVLKDIGFQLGSGFLVGVPGGNTRTLARDIAFMGTIGADMVGVGPYVYQNKTPVGELWEAEHRKMSLEEVEQEKKELVEMTRKVIALLRVTMGDVNIPATTALQALDAVGREKALGCGANVVMPIVTPARWRKEYQLYEGKPCVEDDAPKCARCVDRRVEWAGKTIELGEWGDPPSCGRRTTTGNR